MNNSEVVLAMALRGLGVALLADWLVEDDLRKGRLVTLLESYTTPAAPVYALTPAGGHVSLATATLIEHLATGLRRGA